MSARPPPSADAPPSDAFACPDSRPLPADFEKIRLETIRDSFDRPRWALIMLPEAAIVILAGYLVMTSPELWRQVAAGLCLLLLGLLNLWQPAPRTTEVPAPRFVIPACLVMISGGLDSPVYPFVILAVVAAPCVWDRRPAAMTAAVSLAFTWALMGLSDCSKGAAYLGVRAICMSALIVGALHVGMWLRGVSDEMLRRSLDARDEALRDHVERLREMTTVAAQIAHELKNPLASIKGLAALMEVDPSHAQERLRVMQQEVDRMHATLEEFLNFSRPLAPLSIELVDLRELVQDVARLHAGLAVTKGLTLDTAAAQSLAVHADPRKIKQMLVNLVQNAIDASPAGSTIEFRVDRGEGFAQIRVSDRGPGVPAARLAGIVEPGVTTKDKGSGLGLTIVRALAEQHRGSLALANREGGGLAAVVELPLVCPRRDEALA